MALFGKAAEPLGGGSLEAGLQLAVCNVFVVEDVISQLRAPAAFLLPAPMLPTMMASLLLDP